VLTQRSDVISPSLFKHWTSVIFYKIINKIGSTKMIQGAVDFRLLTRQVVKALRSMPEYHRFMRGMVAWVGYKSIILPYMPPARIAGKSKYSLGRMLRLSMDAVFSFSLVPLYIGISLGVLMLVLAFLEMLYVLNFWVTGNISNLAPGWSSLMFILLLIGGFLMISIGVIGVYIGYIFQEVKGRPVYLIREPDKTVVGVHDPD
ncbi:MAG: glycosyltransferase, partial [Leptolinea sp.]